MLDLRKHTKNHKYELVWTDGTHYTFPLPTQSFLLKVLELSDVSDVNKQFEFVKEIVADILNSNEQNKKFSEEELNLPLDIIQLILEDYMTSVMDILGE